jgi:glutaredoxin
LSKQRVVIYTRPGCHLCEEAKENMRAANCGGEYTLNEINIETDETLLEKYRNDIPVIFVNGEEAFRHRITPEEFKVRIFRSG